MKKIDTIVNDIYEFMSGKGDYPPFEKEHIDLILSRMSDVLYSRFDERRKAFSKEKKFLLRMSNYGTKPRKLWFASHMNTDKDTNLDPHKYLNFLIGDLWECVILSLCELTGHKVEAQQEEVEYEGLVGHLDAVIDGVVVDVKSASKWSFERKFSSGALFNGDDSFAYVPQISAYGDAMGIKEKAFLASNKETGELALVKVPESVNIDTKATIANAFKVINSDTPPEEKCYEEVVEPNGNKQIARDCTFCPHKFDCWASANNGVGLRVFKYASGNKYYSHVEKVPKVEEITDKNKKYEDGFIFKESDYPLEGSATRG